MSETKDRANLIETFATILLAFAAVATAWTTYQSTQWRGEQASHTSKSTAARIESSTAFTRAGQLTQIDVATFTQWVNATVAGDTELADFYRARFRDEFTPAFDAWIATDPLTNPDAPETPFAMPEYVIAEAQKAEQLNQEATRQATAAAESVRRSDNYMLAVVLFAAALFFAGISTKLRSLRHREVLIGLGALIFVSTTIWLATLPVRLVG
jgi:hypothetical protein